ncbi:MAG TPA: alpha/beta hydrolase [Methyloceanibacter sp.]|nr:alpha/beta hydrolase [Methyloceanibacter sp.]
MSESHCGCGKGLRTAPAVVLLLLAALFSAAAIGGRARAQAADDLDRLNHEIERLYGENKTAAAVPLAERYVELARQRYGEDNLEFATALTWLGSLYESQGRFAEAEPLLKGALAIREKALGPDHPLVATSLGNLANLYQREGRTAEAQELEKRAKAIREKAVGSDELEALPRQIQELRWAGKPQEAVTLAEHYVELAKQRYGETQPDFVPPLLLLAQLYASQARPADAEKLFKQAVAIRETALGTDNLLVADALVQLAAFYQAQGRYQEAEALLKRAVSIREKAFGPDSPEIVGSLEALAGLYEAAGRKPEADELWVTIHAIQKQSPQPHFMLMEEPTYAVVKVYYATDRAKTTNPDPAKTYAGDRGDLGLGFCTVSIPRDHRMGALEAPSIWRLEFSNDPEHFVVLLSVTEADTASFYKDVAARVRASAGKNAFIFVHGYNVTFADAARRTAQMAYDLGFDGAPVFYSWPSQASYAAYKVDETNAEWAVLDFKNFLEQFAKQSQADNIFLIAHSMGSRVLAGALKELVLEDPAIRPKFKEIIFAAPDIDADTFRRDIAPKILSKTRSATLYASSGDYALMASKEFAGYPRAGDVSGGVTIAPGLDTIDASSIRTDFIGHSYYGDSTSVLGDLRDLILLRKRPEQRSRLSPLMAGPSRYWTFSH